MVGVRSDAPPCHFPLNEVNAEVTEEAGTKAIRVLPSLDTDRASTRLSL